jgi:hypothetical protein
MLNINTYPALRQLIEDKELNEISEVDALYIYQNHWYKVNTSKLTSEEITKINELVATVGNGVFMASSQ